MTAKEILNQSKAKSNYSYIIPLNKEVYVENWNIKNPGAYLYPGRNGKAFTMAQKLLGIPIKNWPKEIIERALEY